MKGTELRSLSLQEVWGQLCKPSPTLILFHARPDGDAIGSAFALSLLLRECGSESYCVCADELPERLRFLVEGIQESVLQASIPAGFEHARVVTVDSASPAQLGCLYELYGERITLMIDHHERGTRYADHCVLPAAATGEMIFELFRIAGVSPSVRAAELLYAAMTTDTGGFRYSNVTPETHLRAAALLASGIDAARLNHLLLEVKSEKQLRAEHAGFERLHLLCGGRLAVITFPYALKCELGLLDEHLETLVDVARSVRGVEVAAVIRQPGAEPVFRLSMRSSVDFDVSAVCAEFGGGGHVRAAGATMNGFADIAAAEAALVQAVGAC